MSEALDALVSALATETQSLRDLLDLLQEEERLLRLGDTAGLTAVTARKDDWSGRHATLERERSRALQRVAVTLQTGPAPLTLARLAQLAPNSTPPLGALRRELLALVEQLATLNARNRFLIARSLAHLHGFLSTLASTGALAPTYGPDGPVGLPLSPHRFIDRRA